MAVTIDGTSGINTPGVVNTAAETIATTLAVTGVTTFAAGTAALPAITTTGDTNTGIFFPAADTIAFAEGGAEAMRITSAGNVGIGTSSPLNFTNYTTLTLNNASAGGVYAINNNGTNVAQFSGDGSAVALFGLTAIPMTFSTNSTERARIDSSGNFLVGATGTSWTDTVGFYAFYQSAVNITRNGAEASNLNRLTSDGTILGFRRSGTQVGSVSVTTTATAYNTSSDYRLKNSIVPMTGALAKVALLKPCTYKWNINGSDGQGFIAHELDEVVSGCVTGEKDAVDADGNPVYQGIDTSFLVATLTAAIQEQQALITALTTRITALEAA